MEVFDPTFRDPSAAVGCVMVEVGREQGTVITILPEPHRREVKSVLQRRDTEKANHMWPL